MNGTTNALATKPDSAQLNPLTFTTRYRSTWTRLLLSCLGWAVPLAIANPGYAAEKIYVSYSLLERSVSVASLEAYAKDGVPNEDLATYAQYANPTVLQNLRTALVARAEVSPITVAQFLYSPQGEAALKRLGQVVQTDSRVDPRKAGFKAIRAALILAAEDPEGLTLLNFLRKYPAKGIRIDVEQSLKIFNELQRLINQTNRATSAIIQQATTEIVSEPSPQLPFDLRRRGSFTWEKQTLTLNDPSRRTAADVAPTTPQLPSAESLLQGRVYPVDIYLPNIGNARSPKLIPVVVISHGLGSDRTTFAYLAEHLASHGFAVLVPTHPGSDSKQMEALLRGSVSEVAEPTEFANRPLDITYLLNYLEQQAISNPAFQNLNLKQVGAIGQSFGGYTALALAGAPVSFQQLQAKCQDLDNTYNISLLLQCRAQQLEQIEPMKTDFRDPRIVAVMALNPINSVVMGQTSLSQITIPTLIVAGSADTVAPALFEQVEPFIWLTTNEKYLVQMESGTHFSVLGRGGPGSGDALSFPPEVIGPNPAIARRYTTALTLAFFQTYIANKPSYRPYLSAAYARSISELAIRLDLVQSLTADQLAQENNTGLVVAGEKDEVMK